MGLAASLPDFPWDSLAGAKALAASHPLGLVDLSIGTPVDPTPELGQRALTEAANWPGYPTVWGTPELRAAILGYMSNRWDSVPLPESGVMPCIGTKELVAWLPTLLGLGAGDLVVYPEVAYPTYLVGAKLAGCDAIACDDPANLAVAPKLIWINSPSNPTGQVWGPEHLSRWVDYARSVGAIIASDECYGEFGWEADPVSVLRPDICGEDPSGLLVLASLSKRSNLAGYRAGFVAGDPKIVSELVAVRKHAGMMVPGPVQQAMTVLLADQEHVVVQRERYAARREIMRPALEESGFRVEHSEGSLYLWVTRGEPARATVDFLASLGILAAPGDFYGDAGAKHVRIAMTASDEQIASAAARLVSSRS